MNQTQAFQPSKVLLGSIEYELSKPKRPSPLFGLGFSLMAEVLRLESVEEHLEIFPSAGGNDPVQCWRERHENRSTRADINQDSTFDDGTSTSFQLGDFLVTCHERSQ